MPDLRILAGILCCWALAGPSDAAAIPAGTLAPVPTADSPSTLPAGWQHGAFAEIYVRGYADSDGDGIGDLRGLTGKLDYLKALGVSGLWLMPITRSGDHDHGYAVEDYRDVEPAYGTLADFDELLAQAHARGIGVIVDYVINHSSTRHPLFQAAAADRASPYRDWYLWQDVAPQGWKIFDKDPWNKADNGYYFSQFSAGMPDWNLRKPEVLAWHLDNLRFWLNRGVDGFRFDAVPHLVENGKDATRDQPESFAIMRAAVQVVHGYPNRYVVCEATHDEKRWAGAEGCGGAFALWMAPDFAKAAAGDAKAAKAIGEYLKDAPDSMAVMVSNHDLFAGERLWDQVGGDLDAYKAAAAAYLLAPATPFIYYGEEVGMSAAPKLAGDARLRVPMSWSAQGFSAARPFRDLAGNASTQNVEAEMPRGQGTPIGDVADPGSVHGDSLLAWYRKLVNLRRNSPVLSRGRLERSWQWDGGWAYSRELNGEREYVLFNTSAKPTSQRIDYPRRGWCTEVFPNPIYDAYFEVGARKKPVVPVAPRSVLVLYCNTR